MKHHMNLLSDIKHGGHLMKRIKEWLIQRGWWWSRCPSCKKWSSHHFWVRAGRDLHYCCYNCQSNLLTELYGPF